MGPQLDIRSPGSFADSLQGDPEAWALRINSAWRRSLEAVIETGRLLIDAKSRLKHGQWQAMIETQLDFSADTAQRLMALFKEDEDRLTSGKRSHQSALRVYGQIRARPRTNITHRAHATGLAFATVAKAVDRLVVLGILQEVTGQRRDRVFAYQRYVQILNEGAEPL